MKFDHKGEQGDGVDYRIAGEAPPRVEVIKDGPIAVIVAHGMGQQVPFQTLGEFVEGLRLKAGVHGTTVLAKTQFVPQPNGASERISWLEAILELNGQPRVVHFYEIYWAPLTQGVASLSDVIGFLVRAGIGRVKNPFAPFRRWLFGDFRTLKVPGRTPLLLLTALAVIGSLVVLNAAVGAIATAKATGIASSAKWLSPAVLTHLTRTFALLLTVFAVFLVTFGLSKPRSVWWVIRGLFRWLSLFAFIVALGATVWAALITIGSMTSLKPLMAARIVSIAAWADWGVIPVLILVALVLASWFIRAFLLQYIGDVAIYVESHSVDRFSRARQAIRDVAMKTARTVYGTGWYADIAFAGHSLGSVVAYDTLNQLFIEDAQRRGRTRLLLTFGSPLDKTAYLFGSQVGDNSARELLAASLQPLIQELAMRPRWVNVYSPWDIIGGPLDFYDNPEGSLGAPTRVQNHRDPDANTFLAAHGEHWSGTFIYSTFIKELQQELRARNGRAR